MSSLPFLADALRDLADANLLRRRRVTKWLPDGRCEIDGRIVWNFIGNDYLNLAGDPRVIAAAERALHDSGVGARASALLGGRTVRHERLEQELAEFEGTEAAILFPTGMAANVGTISALVKPDDIIFCDRFNHASLIDGCRLSGAKLRVYRHDDLAALERDVAAASSRRSEEQSTAAGSRRHDDDTAAGSRRYGMWIVTDGVFSMDGELAPLPALCDLAEKYHAAVIVDEAHATGVYGERGRGVCEHFGVEDRVAVRIGTLSKAVGCLGGFVAGSQQLIDYLWNSARTQIYSTALPPAVCAAAEAAIGIIQQEPHRIRELQRRSQVLRQLLLELGVELLPASTGPILPIPLHDPRRAVDVADRLEERGYLVGAIRPPTVPRGTSRLRISVSLSPPETLLHEFASVLAEVLK